MHVQINNLLPLASILFGSTSSKILVMNASIEISIMWALMARSGCNPHAGYVVESLDKMLYDDCLCLVTPNKQQIQWTRIWTNPYKLCITENCLAGADFFQQEVVFAIKNARIVQK